MVATILVLTACFAASLYTLAGWRVWDAAADRWDVGDDTRAAVCWTVGWPVMWLRCGREAR